MTTGTIEKLTKERVIQVASEIVVAYGAWGKEVTNDHLRGLCSGREWALIEASRFTARHHPFEPTPFLPNRETIGRTMTEVSIRLAKASLAANKWDRADYLYVATSAPPDEEGKWAEQIAEQIGARKIRISLLACNGGGEAFLSSLKRPELVDKKVVVVAVDALGYLANPHNPVELAIFGTGASVLAYRPANIKLFTGKTVIEEDTKGVIRSPRTYQLPPTEERIEPPNWYEVREGAEGVFAYTERETVMLLPESTEGNPYMEMDGEATAFYFRDKVTSVQMEILSEYYKKYEEPISAYISHQPSGVVSRQICRQLWKYLKKEGLPVYADKDHGISWVMDRVGMGNASSATSLIAFGVLAPDLEPGQRFLYTSYGGGASISAWTGQINP